MPKKINKYDREHLRRIKIYQRQIDKIYQSLIDEGARIVAGVNYLESNKPFAFGNYPATKGRVDTLINQYRKQIEICVINGIKAEWELANDKNNSLVESVFGGAGGNIPKDKLRRFFSNNETAREAFLNRKDNGMNLSDKVWRYSDGFRSEIEMGLDIGLRERKNAQEIARDLKQYLRHPDKLFRRVRDEHGILHLSKNARNFHPGQGVYRSSYMNARRLAATETNMAYRTADYERLQQMDFVVGVEIHLSNNHTCKGSDGIARPFTDICDDLQGKYPKDFKFTGWHPHCRCFATSILKTDAEIDADTRKILNNEPLDGESVNKVSDVPKKFREWLKDNDARLQNASSVPYFLSDNPKYTGVKAHYGAVGAFTGTKLGRAATKTAYKAYEGSAVTTLNDNQRKNIDSIAHAMGTTAKPMNFLEADNGRGNVNFNKGGMYKENCQICVAVHEARLRGLNITALGYDGRQGSLSYNLGEHFEKAWISQRSGKVPQLTKLRADTDEALFDKVEKQASAVGRYHIGINFKNGTGHVITAERMRSGEFVCYDAQSGEFLNIKELAAIDYIELLKVDKLLMNKDILVGVSELIQ